MNYRAQAYPRNRIANLGVFTPKLEHGKSGCGVDSPDKRILHLTKCLEQMPIRSTEKKAHRNEVEYLDGLLRDLAEIVRLMPQNPMLFCHVYGVLMGEAFSVWSRLRREANNKSPDFANSIHNEEPMGYGSPGLQTYSSREVPSMHRESSEIPKAKIIRTHLLPDGKIRHEFQMDKKIFIPEIKSYNFIGRIVGPRGISVRHMEAQTKCDIVIRGKGSIKDPNKEQKFMSRRGYEHLKEPLHAYILSECDDAAECQARLEKATNMIDSLLVPAYDDYKGAYRSPRSYQSPKNGIIRRSKKSSE